MSSSFSSLLDKVAKSFQMCDSFELELKESLEVSWFHGGSSCGGITTVGG